jgi:hypothetical protein
MKDLFEIQQVQMDNIEALDKKVREHLKKNP